MARKSNSTTTEAPAPENEAVNTEAVNTDSDETDLSAFLDAATASLESQDYSAVNAAYAELDRKGKGAATREVNKRMKEALLGGQQQEALGWVTIGETVKSKPASEKKVREPKAPADPTAVTVERLSSLYLAWTIASDPANLPEGLADDWKAQVKAASDGARTEADQLIAHRNSTDENKGDAPEVSEVAQRAVRLALQGSGRKSSTGSHSTYEGPRRSITKHIEEAFAGHPSGTFLSVSDLRNFVSSEYGEDNPSAGAISSGLKSPKFNVEGIIPGNGGEKGVFGATKA